MLRRRTLGGWEAAAIRSPSPRGGRVRSAVHELRRRRRCPPLYFIILPTHPDRGRLSGHLKCFPLTRVTSSAAPAGLTGRSLSGTRVPARHCGAAGTVRAGDTWAALTRCLASAHLMRVAERRPARRSSQGIAGLKHRCGHTMVGGSRLTSGTTPRFTPYPRPATSHAAGSRAYHLSYTTSAVAGGKWKRQGQQVTVRRSLGSAQPRGTKGGCGLWRRRGKQGLHEQLS